ncbi:hypothetical protein FACS1894186_4380 [Alphaproteobacteria bacterium]|nr:hypothetical protein FACS1894186_4380 [Alphaproteobacteria bacterium]
MRNFDDYMTAARRNQNLNSNSKLATQIGITSTAICRLTQGYAIPADSTILKLAELAGIPAEEALIDVSLWRAELQYKDNPAVKSAWEKLAKKIKLAVVLFFLSACPALASPSKPAQEPCQVENKIAKTLISQSLYYVNY